jgi:cyclic 2,3-diphosphoglycerate synthetase
VADGPVIALIDGEHHPPAVRDTLDRLHEGRGVAGVVFCGGEEKVSAAALADPAAHYGRDVITGKPPDVALRDLASRDRGALAAAGKAAAAVLDLADEPVLDPTARLRLAALALHLGLAYEAPGMRLTPPPYASVPFDGRTLAVIGTGKRSGKTAVAGHWANLLRAAGDEPAIVCMGRGGPPTPQIARAGIGVEDLLAISDAGAHAASDYLEGAALAGVTTVGCRRVGGGLSGEPGESNMAEATRVAAEIASGALILEGSGSCIPPVAADRTVCVVGSQSIDGLDRYRVLRADLCLAFEEIDCPGPSLRFDLKPEPAEPIPENSRVATFTTRAERCEGVEPVLSSRNLSRRSALGQDLDRAAAEGCDVYLTELKGAAIDTVATRARDEGARVIFLRNRPVGIDADLDAALMDLYADA